MKSILFSLFQHFRHLSLPDALSDTFKALFGILRALRIRSGDARMLGAVRTTVCKDKCEFYDEKWQTCGTPGETMRDEFGIRHKIGCWCYLPLANRDPQKDCWARAHDIHRSDGVSTDGSPVGWPDVLRPNIKS